MSFQNITVTHSSLWRLIKWARTRSHILRQISKISDLIKRDDNDQTLETIIDFESKVELLQQAFFSSIAEIDLSDTQNYRYSEAMSEQFSHIEEDEIRSAIRKCKSNSASNSDEILNRILKFLTEKLMSHLKRLFRVCATLSYHFLCFREAHMIALKKSNKKNYTDIKVYRSIALLNTLDKTLESIVTKRINALTEAHDLLSSSQMKSRKERNCDTTLKLLIEQIHTIWNMRKNKIATLLSMNVVDVFDHVSKNRLLHNLRKRKISHWTIAWINNFMQHRHITLFIDNETTMMRQINADIS